MNYEEVAGIIRTYNNNQAIVQSVSRALGNGLGLVIVVVNAGDPAARGNVRGWLADQLTANPSRLAIIEMEQGYSWSNALNAGLAGVRLQNSLFSIAPVPEIRYVLAISNEVLWEPEHLAAMLKPLHGNPRLGAAGTTFSGWQNDQPVGLGVSYRHPRNTLMLIRLEAFYQVGHFEALCDGLGGMEDLYFIVELLMGGRDFGFCMVDQAVPLLVGLNHNQAEKEIREQLAMVKIVEHWRCVIRDAHQLIRCRFWSVAKKLELATLAGDLARRLTAEPGLADVVLKTKPFGADSAAALIGKLFKLQTEWSEAAEAKPVQAAIQFGINGLLSIGGMVVRTID